MIAQSVGIGIVVSFFCTEFFGLCPGGLIVPGYLAFFLFEPARIAATFVAAMATFGLVMWCSNYFIIYGRRRFMVCILSGYCLGWLIEALGTYLNSSSLDIRAIGYIIPGLIANEMVRQGVTSTVLATLLSAGLVRLLLVLLVL